MGQVRVVKTTGDVEDFDPNVVWRECIEAGVDSWTAGEVAVKELRKRVYDGITTRDVRQKTLEILFEINPEDGERYRRYHSMFVHTSSHSIEGFDRKKIALSLLKETRIPKEVADTIAHEAEMELRKLRLDFISGPLIREIVNVKLLEHRMEDARADYTRLGLPVYDAKAVMERGPHHDPETVHRVMADSIFKEYILLKTLPMHLGDAHMRGDLHTHGLEHFFTRPYSGNHDLRWFLKNGLAADMAGSLSSMAGPARRAEVAINHAVKVLAAGGTHFSGPQYLDNFTTLIAPYLKGFDYDSIKQIAQSFVYEAGQMYCSPGGAFYIGIDYGVAPSLAEVPAVLPGGVVKEKTYADFEEEARLFARALTDLFLNGDHFGRPFFSPIPVYKLRDEDVAKEGYDDYILDAHRMAARFGTAQFTRGNLPRESLQVVTLNLPRIAYQAKGSDKELFKVLDKKLTLAREVLMVKHDLIKTRLQEGFLPLLTHGADAPYYNIDEALHSIGYVGLNEMCKAHTGSELHEGEEAVGFGIKVMEHMRTTLEDWSRETGFPWALTQTTDDGVVRRLAKQDYGQFAGSAVVRGDFMKGDLYYTNSALVREDAGMEQAGRLEIEGRFHALNTGGMSAEVGVEGDAKGLVKISQRIIKDTRIRQWTFTQDMTHCPGCQRIMKGIHDTCLVCETDGVEHFSRQSGQYYKGKGRDYGQ